MLLDDLRAGVHVNANGELTVILKLLDREFGLSSTSLYQTCLYAQASYTIATKLDINPTIIARKLDSEIKRFKKTGELKSTDNGITPETVINALNNKIVSFDDKRLKLLISFQGYTDLSQILSAIDQGHPVIIPVNHKSGMHQGLHDLRFGLGRVDPSYKSINRVTNTADDSYHAYLAIGYDKGDQTVVVRESRSRYGFKGYAKVPYDVVEAHTKMAFTFIVNVKVLA